MPSTEAEGKHIGCRPAESGVVWVAWSGHILRPGRARFALREFDTISMVCKGLNRMSGCATLVHK